MTQKEKLYQYIENEQDVLNSISDQIFDRPEIGMEEYFASGLLSDYLEKQGFTVERGLGTVQTAFRAEMALGTGEGPVIGLLCEYDALEMGHGCGHHMQGPVICGAAAALKDCADGLNGKIIVYGTPAEENVSGKTKLLEQGFMKDIDLALMVHGGPETSVDIVSMASAGFQVTFHGQSSHAAMTPEAGRSALDALILTFNGVEFLREHVQEDTRMHYTVNELPGPANVVPAKAVGKFSLRSYNTTYLEQQVIPRFKDIVKGAALMTGTTCEIDYRGMDPAQIPADRLNEIAMDNARALNAPNIQPPRTKSGSTDFASVTCEVPGCCVRLAYVPKGAPAHSQIYLDCGKAQAAHDAIAFGAKIIAATTADILARPAVVEEIWQEYRQTKQRLYDEGSSCPWTTENT